MNRLLIYFPRITKVAAIVSALMALDATNADEPGVNVKPLSAQHLSNVPGQSLTAVTVTYAPGGKSSAHRHAGSVFVYVLSGAIKSENSAIGPAKVYHAGESFFEPPGSEHLISENASTTEPASLLAVFVAEDGAQLTTYTETHSALSEKDLARRIFETMLTVHGNQPGHRTVHAKGLVCEGTFASSPTAAALSKAAHFSGGTVPITARFSDGSPDPSVADNSPDAGPRGLAIRFKLPGGGETDIVAMSHNGFVVGTGEEFLALQQAVAKLDPTQPHPWAIEEFLGSHPLALRFVQENRILPMSSANEAFFSNDAFVFVNKTGAKQAGRYQVLPVAGRLTLAEADAKARPANFLMDDLKARLAKEPIRFRLMVQIPNPGDPTNDPSQVWPDDRKTIDMGLLTIVSVVADNAARENELAFDPAELTDGIELSDDPFPALRSRVYSLAARHRHAEALKSASLPK